MNVLDIVIIAVSICFLVFTIIDRIFIENKGGKICSCGCKTCFANIRKTDRCKRKRKS